MAQNNFEEQIKNRLSPRTIEPSNDAWKLVEAQLVQKKTRRFDFRYLYGTVAAVFIGVLFIFNFTNINTTHNEEQPIVDIDSHPEIIKKEAADKFIAQDVINDSNQKQKDAIVKVAEKDRKTYSKKIVKKEEIVQNINLHEDKTLLENKREEAFVLATHLIKEKEDSLVDSKVKEVVASISQLNQENGEITDAEINALLEKAQREINTQRILKNTKVDATALLLDVEEEIDRSFRDKVFEAIKNSYSKVKTAVAVRNH